MRGFTGTIAIYCSVKRWKRKKIGRNEGKKKYSANKSNKRRCEEELVRGFIDTIASNCSARKWKKKEDREKLIGEKYSV